MKHKTSIYVYVTGSWKANQDIRKVNYYNIKKNWNIDRNQAYKQHT